LKQKNVDDKKEEKKHDNEGSDKEMSEGEEAEEEVEEIEEKVETKDSVSVGDWVYLINQRKFANVKTCIQDTLFECVCKDNDI
jgi:hypothetical protein